MRAAWGAAAAVMLAVPGCAPTVILTAGMGALQAGTSAFINGELESAQVLPIDDVRGAVIQALEAMQFELISQLHHERSSSYTATEKNGRSITIRLSAKSPVVTKTNIRVGLMGDQVMSRLILGEIQARCPAIPSVMPPDEEPAP